MLLRYKINIMKAFKYFTIALLLAGSMAACGDRSKATLGGTQDTSTVAGSQDTSSADSASKQSPDSTSKGNANPTGKMENDTTKTK
jgi:hypothetical protein